MKLYAICSASILLGCLVLIGSQSSVAQEPKLRAKLHDGHQQGIRVDGFFSPDGKLLVTKSDVALLWDVATEKSTKIGDVPADPLFFNPDGNLLVLTRNRDFQIYDIPGRKNTVYKTSPMETNQAMSPDGRRHLLIKNKVLSLRDLATPYDLSTGGNTVAITGASVPISVSNTSSRGAPILPMQFSADGKIVVVRDKDNNFLFWDVSSSKGTTIPNSDGLDFALSPDGKNLVARCSAKAPSSSLSLAMGEIQIFELATGKSVAILDGGIKSSVTTMYYSPDSKVIAAASVYQIILWDAATGKNKAVLQKPKSTGNDHIFALHFSPDSKTVVATAGRAFDFWDIASGKVTGSLPSNGSRSAFLAFSPDGAMLATADNDGNIRLWDMPGGEPADRK